MKKVRITLIKGIVRRLPVHRAFQTLHRTCPQLPLLRL